MALRIRYGMSGTSLWNEVLRKIVDDRKKEGSLFIIGRTWISIFSILASLPSVKK